MRNLLIAAVGAVTVSALVACGDTATGPSSLGSEGVAVSETGLNTLAWQGHGSDHIDGCVAGFHWILAPAQGITSTPRFYSNLDDGEIMFRSENAGENAAWHYNSGLVDTQQGSHPYVTFDGSPHPQVKLILSHCLDDDGATLSVTKTADTEFERVHEWDIDKRVETDEIWLYTDGSGDETATWTVDVEYEGAFDRGFVIAGNVYITNISNPAESKTITSIVDDLGFNGHENIALQCEDASGATFDPKTDLPRDIDPAETWICSYRVEFDDGEIGQGDAGTNTVTVAVANDGSSPYVGTDGWEFYEPTSVLYDEVTIEDVSDLFGAKELGKVSAPNSDSFTYNKLFAYADYGDARCGIHEYGNTATIVETEQSAEATLKVNVQCLQWESAWAMADDENPDHVSPSEGSSATAHSFCENGFNNWGWSNEVKRDYAGKWPLYAGAGRCDISKGTFVGYFEITHESGEFSYAFEMESGFFHEDEAVYADVDRFPRLRNGRNTTAPGQYYVADSLEDVIHVIAHINAGIPDPDFGPED
jgi:hypothetical protein